MVHQNSKGNHASSQLISQVNTCNNVSNVYKPFQSWKLGTINIRSGKQKDQRAKVYSTAKEIDRLKLELCCLQKWNTKTAARNWYNWIVEKDTNSTGAGIKKKRTAGVGCLIKVDPGIIIKDPDVLTPRIIATNIVMHGFNKE